MSRCKYQFSYDPWSQASWARLVFSWKNHYMSDVRLNDRSTIDHFTALERWTTDFYVPNSKRVAREATIRAFHWLSLFLSSTQLHLLPKWVFQIFGASKSVHQITCRLRDFEALKLLSAWSGLDVFCYTRTLITCCVGISTLTRRTLSQF